MTAITIQLEQADYDRLVTEADRRGVEPHTLIQALVRSSLSSSNGTPQGEAERRSKEVHATLEALRELRERQRRAGYPSVDAVQIVRESREELERRSDFLWESESIRTSS